MALLYLTYLQQTTSTSTHIIGLKVELSGGFNPFEITLVKLDHLPRYRDEKKNS